jgi:hypothetical protein
MLAGLGTAGMLVGAVAAVAALTVGVVAFSAWPGSPEADRRPAVVLGGERGGGAPAEVALATRNAIAESATSQSTAAARRAAAQADAAGRRTAGGTLPQDSERDAQTGGSGTGATSTQATNTATETAATQETERRRPVTDLTIATGKELGGAVKDGGAAIGEAARPVSAPAADALAVLSERVGDAVTAATRALSEVLRGTPNRPPGG